MPRLSKAAAALIVAVLCQATTALSEDFTKVLRYLPESGDYAGLACHALVLEEVAGLPHSIANLGELEPSLCQPRGGEVDPKTTTLALETASLVRSGEMPAPESERIGEHELTARILPPIAFGQAAIDERRRIVIGVGLNYFEHSKEVGKAGGADAAGLLLIPKVTPPTSAYAPIPTGTAIGSAPPRPVNLMDYEAEIGFVVLEDIDLKAPPSRDELLARSAFFASNDISDRRPIIVDDENGYTRGKSHPGYLPIGPWLVPARELDLASQTSGETVLGIELKVTAAGKTARQELRQVSTSKAMVYGPAAIITELSRRFVAGETLCMPDFDGEPRILHDGNGVIPAGSLILTGTPDGTAIKSPSLIDKARLFVEGWFSIRGAREEMIEEHEEDARELGYLAPGDSVDVAIDNLGRQRWQVIEAELRNDNGIAGSGPCGDFHH